MFVLFESCTSLRSGAPAPKVPGSKALSVPPDPSGYGFDNIGDALTLTPVQVEQYHKAAKTIVRELLSNKQENAEAYNSVFFIRPNADLEETRAARQVIERFATHLGAHPIRII